jgi:hypothetical protein
VGVHPERMAVDPRLRDGGLRVERGFRVSRLRRSRWEGLVAFRSRGIPGTDLGTSGSAACATGARRVVGTSSAPFGALLGLAHDAEGRRSSWLCRSFVQLFVVGRLSGCCLCASCAARTGRPPWVRGVTPAHDASGVGWMRSAPDVSGEASAAVSPLPAAGTFVVNSAAESASATTDDEVNALGALAGPTGVGGERTPTPSRVQIHGRPPSRIGWQMVAFGTGDSGEPEEPCPVRGRRPERARRSETAVVRLQGRHMVMVNAVETETSRVRERQIQAGGRQRVAGRVVIAQNLRR